MAEWDVIVVGAGHAGCEAALASARLGMKTLVLTLSLDNIALMPCNPSIGGPAKGHLVREIDALGGEMARNIDGTMMQIRKLNTRKGPAVHALRAQADRRLYHLRMKEVLEKEENLWVREAIVEELLVEGDRVVGVRTQLEGEIRARAVVMTTGTYLRGRVHIGEMNYASGPQGFRPANRLSENLADLGLRLVRFKTGTPPRVNGRSLDYSKMELLPGQALPERFAFYSEPLSVEEQAKCWLTYTNERTREIIEKHMHESAMYGGGISGVGPRYCPSIETKIHEFPDRVRHQVFVEPEGWSTKETYLSGLSTSLPARVQDKFLRTVPGLEKVEVLRWGYAIEYDCLDPTQLSSALAVKSLRGLYAAGQLNGTSGYEEAAAQGLIAGINAALFVKGAEPIVLDRATSYIGVLIDDLVTKGTNEPYRMMTSRAEYRLLLRQDNADERLTPVGYRIGLIDEERYARHCRKWEAVERERNRLRKSYVQPEQVNPVLEGAGSSPIREVVSLEQLLKRPEVSYEDLEPVDPGRPRLSGVVREQVQLQIRYEGYIKKQERAVERFRRLEKIKLPLELDYERVGGLSREAAEKLARMRPASLGQAARISGVSPADISVLMVYLERERKKTPAERGAR